MGGSNVYVYVIHSKTIRPNPLDWVLQTRRAWLDNYILVLTFGFWTLDFGLGLDNNSLFGV